MIGGLVFLLGTLAMTAVTLYPGPVRRLVERCLHPLPERPRDRLLDLCCSFLAGLAVLRRGRVVVLTSALSVAAWLSEAAMYYLIMRGFGIDLGPLPALLGMAAANLGTIVPSSFAFVGTFDVPLQSVLTELFGLDGNLATSVTLVVHASLMVPVVTLGLLFLWREGLSLWDLSRLSPSTKIAAPRTGDSAARRI